MKTVIAPAESLALGVIGNLVATEFADRRNAPSPPATNPGCRSSRHDRLHRSFQVRKVLAVLGEKAGVPIGMARKVLAWSMSMDVAPYPPVGGPELNAPTGTSETRPSADQLGSAAVQHRTPNMAATPGHWFPGVHHEEKAP